MLLNTIFYNLLYIYYLIYSLYNFLINYVETNSHRVSSLEISSIIS